MAKNKKPKFLEAETPDLLALLKETLSDDEVDEKAVAKALKIAEELISRQPEEEGPVSVDEALKTTAEIITGALNMVKKAYDQEISLMEGSEEPEEPEEAEEEVEEEEEETSKPKKAKKDKKSKKSKKAEPEEEEDAGEDPEEEDSEEEDDGEDYSDWATKDLKKECRTRGIKVTKGMSKADMVKALEADDQE